MAYAVKNVKYRTSAGRVDFIFDFIYVGNGWRIYIVSQPSYGNRGAGTFVTHRLTDGARHYVCWDRPIATLDAAKGVAGMWADCTQQYIQTGSFSAPHNRGHVRDVSTSANWHLANRPGDPERLLTPVPRPATAVAAPARPAVPNRPTGPARPPAPARPRGFARLFRSH